MAEIPGTPGDDNLTGTAFDDTLSGLGGADTLSGLGGDDLLIGGSGNDSVNGGTGNDTVLHVVSDNTGTTDRYDGGAGTDTLRFEMTSFEFASLKGEMLSFEGFVRSGVGGTFTFNLAGIEAVRFEAIEVTVDGVAVDIGNLPGAADDAVTVQESEGPGDFDINVLGNERGIAVVSVAGLADMVGTPAPGSAGGTFTINADGTVDFDAAGDFEFLAEGETATTTVAYEAEVPGVEGKYDLVLVQDLSGSFFNDLPNVQGQFGSLFDSLAARGDDVGFGVASFVDKPVSPFGSAIIGDYAYRTDQAVSTDKAETQATLDSLAIRSGGDGPESQLVALQQVALRATTDIGYREDAQRFIVLQTDNVFHEAGDFLAPPDDGDIDTDETEDYPTVASVGALLRAAGITVIFAVTTQRLQDYRDLLADLGTDGAVVELSSNSSNLASAVIKGLNTFNTFETAQLTVTVVGENDDPVAIADTASVDEDDQVVIAVLDNDSDVDGESLTVTDATGAANGTLAINADNTVTYTPDAGFNGTDSFVYTVSDGKGGTDTATVTVIVGAVNDLPLAVADSASGDEDTGIVIDVLQNDSDPDNDGLTVIDATRATNGTLTINADGTITYLPDADFNGSDEFLYTISDGNGGTAFAAVSVLVRAVNDNPVAADDLASVAEDGSVDVPVLDNDSDVDGDTLTVATAGGAANGTVSVQPDGTVRYVPDPGFNGDDSFTYTISDGAGGTATATVNVSVGAVNDLPVVADDALTLDEDGSATVDVLDNDFDPDGDTLSVTAISDPASGTVSVEPDGSLRYTPDPDVNGTDSFTYTVSDGNGGTATATVTVTINAVNDAPVATPDTASVDEDGSVNVDVLGNDLDIDGDTLSVSAIGAPANGTVTIEADGTLTYTPDPDFNGTDSFTYTVSDGAGGTDIGTVVVTVGPVNDAPVAGDDSLTIDEDSVLSAALLLNDTDVDGDVLSVTATSVGAPGSASPLLSTGGRAALLTVTAEGAVELVPDPAGSFDDLAFGESDQFIFTYTVSDGNGGTDSGEVTVTVTGINDAPVAVADVANGVEDQPLTIAVLDNDLDVEGQTLEVDAFTNGADGTVVMNADGTLTYTPDAGFNGVDTFFYTVSDGSGGQDTASVSVNIGAENDAPVANPDAATVDEDGSVEVDVLANDTDEENDTLTVIFVEEPANGSVSEASPGLLTYTPDPDFFGDDSFTYTVSDGNGGTGTAVVSISVTPQPDAPVAVDDIGNAESDGTVTLNLTANDIDPDNDDLRILSLDLAGLSGLVSLDADGDRVTYDPNGQFDALGEGETAEDTFSYTVSDGTGRTDTATVTITVGGLNDAPIAIDDTGEVAQAGIVSIDVLANDQDPNGDTPEVLSFTDGANGTVALNADGTLRYSPERDFFGEDTFGYTITDGRGGTASAEVVVTVIQNFAPFIPEPVVFNAEENQFRAAVLQAIDIEGDEVSFSIEGGVDVAFFDLNPQTAVLSFLAAPDFENPADANGDNRYEIDIGVSDEFGTNVQSVLINVTNLPDTADNAPKITGQVNTVNFVDDDPGVLELTVLTQGRLTQYVAEDLDGDDLVFSLFGEDAARFTLDPVSGVLRLPTPITDARGSFDGDAIFELQILVEDGNGGSDIFEQDLFLFTVA